MAEHLHRSPYGCIVCGVAMGGEPDPLRCHDCTSDEYMVATSAPGVELRIIQLGHAGPVELPAAGARAQELRAALEAYRAEPLDVHDRPESWAALERLLEAADATLAAMSGAPAGLPWAP